MQFLKLHPWLDSSLSKSLVSLRIVLTVPIAVSPIFDSSANLPLIVDKWSSSLPHYPLLPEAAAILWSNWKRLQGPELLIVSSTVVQLLQRFSFCNSLPLERLSFLSKHVLSFQLLWDDDKSIRSTVLLYWYELLLYFGAAVPLLLQSHLVQWCSAQEVVLYFKWLLMLFQLYSSAVAQYLVPQ